MSPLTPSQLIFIARQHYDAGRLTAAEDLCRKVLSEGPPRADALRLAGLIADRAGRHDAAAQFLLRAAALDPDNPALHSDLGRIYRRSGKLDNAIAAFREALRLGPGRPDVLCDLADALSQNGAPAEAAEAYQQAHEQRPGAVDICILWGDALLGAGRAAQAAGAFERALAGRPQDPDIYLKLGSALQSAGRDDEAVAAFRAAAELAPHCPEPLDRLGTVLHHAARLGEAQKCFEQAIARDPAYAPAQVHLGDCLLDMGFADPALDAYRRALALDPTDASLVAQLREALPDELLLDEAIARCQAATARNPDDAQAFCNLGVACHRRRDADAAINAYRKALQLSPGNVAAMNNLGLTLKDAGQIKEATDCLRNAVELNPEFTECHDNLLYLLHFDAACDAGTLHQEHTSWRRRHADPLKDLRKPHNNHRSPDRRLRIGYVSPNFRQHSVGRFLTALFDNHDHEKFEIVGYSSVGRPDGITSRIRQRCDRWVDATRLSDEALAEQVRGDGIDILVDLTMHMADSRLLAFARKPAPVQAAYLAYCSTTGLDTIDYRITDPYLDPSEGDREQSPQVNPEQPLRLPRTYWCYDPGTEAPDVNRLPAMSRGHVTFASLNNYCKASPAALTLWARIMREVPSAQLMLHAWPGAHRERTREFFADQGVGPSRLRFFDMLSLPRYLRLHHAIDIALDPFPYPGGTTTCDALWMGVPTVSLVGRSPFTRGGLSILSNVGLPELAVESREKYLETAVALAGDLPRLARLRGTMRDRLRESPLTDGRGFARDVEAAYRSIWRRWCGT